MPLVLMRKCYEYDDEYHSVEEGGFPELVFGDDQEGTAYAKLTEERVNDFTQCTPLSDYYYDSSLSELSSSGLEDDTLLAALCEVLGQDFTLKGLLHTDFRNLRLNQEQKVQVAMLLDIVADVYLVQVPSYGG